MFPNPLLLLGAACWVLWVDVVASHVDVVCVSQVFFSSCNSVKFHSELLNYIDIPVMDIHGRQKQQKRTTSFFQFCKQVSEADLPTLRPPGSCIDTILSLSLPQLAGTRQTRLLILKALHQPPR